MLCSRLNRPGVERSAEVSACARYRYALRRTWDPARPPALFVGLNPATADDARDDLTVCRCVGFAEAWGCGGVLVANLFAYRATHPPRLWAAAAGGVDPVGPETDRWLAALARDAGVVVAAWGGGARQPAREREVLAILHAAGRSVECLGTTAAGAPRHPSRLRTGAARAAYAAQRGVGAAE